jgi:ABC-type transport system involved in cytochrome bd biosynthesis fused ATPase/permease subunit
MRKSTNAIEIIEGSFSWEEGDFELRNINLEIVKGSLNVIVGPVGSGKSSLISAILGKMKKNEGKTHNLNKFHVSISNFFV